MWFTYSFPSFYLPCPSFPRGLPSFHHLPKVLLYVPFFLFFPYFTHSPTIFPLFVAGSSDPPVLPSFPSRISLLFIQFFSPLHTFSCLSISPFYFLFSSSHAPSFLLLPPSPLPLPSTFLLPRSFPLPPQPRLCFPEPVINSLCPSVFRLALSLSRRLTTTRFTRAAFTIYAELSSYRILPCHFGAPGYLCRFPAARRRV